VHNYIYIYIAFLGNLFFTAIRCVLTVATGGEGFSQRDSFGKGEVKGREIKLV